ncbi:MAG: carbamate kinase, partial [Chloroflexota bacterium]
MIQKALYNEFRKRGLKKQAVTVVTQVLVDRNDPAFRHPTKPIGSFMDEKTARERSEKEGWNVIEDAGRGWG